MGENSETPSIFDLRFQTEDLTFKPDEMTECRCGRKNPPNRLKCMYCGLELELKAENTASIKPILRKLEAWESGFNVIFRETDGNAEIGKAAALLSVEATDLSAILNAGSPLPVARVESTTEANILIAGLSKLNLKCSMISDIELDADKLPIRLSNIEFCEGGIAVTDFNTRQITEIDLALIVPGLLTLSKTDSLEKKRRHGKTKLLDESEISSDEIVIDIYNRRDPRGYRIYPAGFDFSCLGVDKGMIAVENMRLLIVALKEHAPHAKLVSDYAKVRHALGSIWEVESRKDPKGLQRSGFGKVEFGSVSSTSNLQQFTKYSRLQWHLL